MVAFTVGALRGDLADQEHMQTNMGALASHPNHPLSNPHQSRSPRASPAPVADCALRLCPACACLKPNLRRNRSQVDAQSQHFMTVSLSLAAVTASRTELTSPQPQLRVQGGRGMWVGRGGPRACPRGLRRWLGALAAAAACSGNRCAAIVCDGRFSAATEIWESRDF